jgi:hypothetical protein
MELGNATKNTPLAETDYFFFFTVTVSCWGTEIWPNTIQKKMTSSSSSSCDELLAQCALDKIMQDYYLDSIYLHRVYPELARKVDAFVKHADSTVCCGDAGSVLTRSRDVVDAFSAFIEYKVKESTVPITYNERGRKDKEPPPYDGPKPHHHRTIVQPLFFYEAICIHSIHLERVDGTPIDWGDISRVWLVDSGQGTVEQIASCMQRQHAREISAGEPASRFNIGAGLCSAKDPWLLGCRTSGDMWVAQVEMAPEAIREKRYRFVVRHRAMARSHNDLHPCGSGLGDLPFMEGMRALNYTIKHRLVRRMTVLDLPLEMKNNTGDVRMTFFHKTPQLSIIVTADHPIAKIEISLGEDGEEFVVSGEELKRYLDATLLEKDQDPFYEFSLVCPLLHGKFKHQSLPEIIRMNYGVGKLHRKDTALNRELEFATLANGDLQGCIIVKVQMDTAVPCSRPCDGYLISMQTRGVQAKHNTGLLNF